MFVFWVLILFLIVVFGCFWSGFVVRFYVVWGDLKGVFMLVEQ
jgi:hypothetical protein